jgi:hypothetical protein
VCVSKRRGEKRERGIGAVRETPINLSSDTANATGEADNVFESSTLRRRLMQGGPLSPRKKSAAAEPADISRAPTRHTHT